MRHIITFFMEYLFISGSCDLRNEICKDTMCIYGINRRCIVRIGIYISAWRVCYYCNGSAINIIWNFRVVHCFPKSQGNYESIIGIIVWLVNINWKIIRRFTYGRGFINFFDVWYDNCSYYCQVYPSSCYGSCRCILVIRHKKKSGYILAGLGIVWGLASLLVKILLQWKQVVSYMDVI